MQRLLFFTGGYAGLLMPSICVCAHSLAEGRSRSTLSNSSSVHFNSLKSRYRKDRLMDEWNTLFLLPQFQERPQVEIVCWTVIKLHFKCMSYKNIGSSCPKGAWRTTLTLMDRNVYGLFWQVIKWEWSRWSRHLSTDLYVREIQSKVKLSNSWRSFDIVCRLWDGQTITLAFYIYI